MKTRNYRDALRDFLIIKPGSLFSCTVCGYTHIGGIPWFCLKCSASHHNIKED